MTTSLAPTEPHAEERALAQAAAEELNLQLVKDMLCPGISDEQLQLFGEVCKRTGLNPFKREIYAILRRDGQTGRAKLTIHTGIDGFRTTAARTGHYRGQTAPEWCGEDGAWRDVWLSAKPPTAARVGVYRDDAP